MKSDVIEITGRILHRTEKAVLFSDTGLACDAVWLPLSKIEVYDNDRDATLSDILLPEWVAKEKDLI